MTARRQQNTDTDALCLRHGEDIAAIKNQLKGIENVQTELKATDQRQWESIGEHGKEIAAMKPAISGIQTMRESLKTVQIRQARFGVVIGILQTLGLAAISFIGWILLDWIRNMHAIMETVKTTVAQ